MIRPQASPDTAHHALTTAAQHGNTASIELLVTPIATTSPEQHATINARDARAGPTQTVAIVHPTAFEVAASAEQARWETEGGSVDNLVDDSIPG